MVSRFTFRLKLVLCVGFYVFAEETCRDYARYDGNRYTGAELYSCATYCQTRWCSSKSYVTPMPKGKIPSVYVDGVVDMYFTVTTVGRNPKNMTGVPKAWDSAANYFSKGYHYDYWDGELVSDKLNSSAAIWQYVDTAGPPPPQLVDACKAVSEKLGRPTYLVDDGWKFCEDFPEHLKREGDRNITYPDGTVIDPYFWWNTGCKIPRNPNGTRNTYWWSCKVSDNNTMLWDANTFGADPTDTTDTNLITWAFNLPWDVACCCCGGGTRANKPGDQMIFKINSEFPDIAAKLTEANYTNLAKFLTPDGLYINTTGHPDWVHELYPNATSTDLTGSLVYTFQNKTYPADVPKLYIHDNGNITECQDLSLEDDIENYTLSFKDHAQVWLDWSSYDCRYYAEDACSGGQASKSWNSSGWGPFQFFYNGHIKNGTGHGPRNGTQLRAHAGNVCCTCGGGKINGRLVKPHDDFDYDANFLALQQALSSTRFRKMNNTPRVESSGIPSKVFV